MAATVGLVNGLIYVKGRLPHPFIATLAMLSVASGLALYLADSQTIQGAPGIVDKLGTGRITWIPGAGHFGWFPIATLVVLVVGLLVMLGLRALVWGRWVYAVGVDPEAAVRTGIPVPSVLISVYVLSGLIAGVAALLMGRQGRCGVAHLRFAGRARRHRSRHHRRSQLPRRPRHGDQRDHRGALIIAVMRNGLNLLGIDPNWQYIATGVVIVVAVELDVLRGQLENRFRSLQAAES